MTLLVELSFNVTWKTKIHSLKDTKDVPLVVMCLLATSHWARDTNISKTHTVSLFVVALLLSFKEQFCQTTCEKISWILETLSYV